MSIVLLARNFQQGECVKLPCYLRWNYRSLVKFAPANKKDLNHCSLGNFLLNS
jgi:hypothetical protein